MNPLTLVKRIQKINQREASLGISDEASWHAKYKDSAYVFVGGVPFDLTEGDLLAVFAQYGEIVDVNLVRDKATGKSKGFAFVAYEDQRSTNLAVDNLNGAQILGRIIRVDHCSNYKKKEEEDEETERQKREARGVCRAFQRGECNRGASCKFSHDEQRAANTGWGAEEDRHSKWDHDGFDGPRRHGRQPNQSAHVPESNIREGHRVSDKDSEVSKSKTRDRHHDRHVSKSSEWDSRETQKRSDKVKEMDHEGDQDRSPSDRKSRRRDDGQLSREDYAKRDDKKVRRHESEYHRKKERESRERGYSSAYERNSSPNHCRMDDDEQLSREDRDKKDEKRSRGYKSESYCKEAQGSRAGDRKSGYDRESSPCHRRTDEDRGHRSHR